MILYQGPSDIDGRPVVAIATGYRRPSANPKTGPCVQVWILRADLHPQEALIRGADESVCGGCLHRGAPGSGRDCYVTMHTVGNVFKEFTRGQYARATTRRDIFRATAYGVRLGAYGDPRAVPASAWGPVVQAAPWVVGYTQFPQEAAELRAFCMASANSLAQANDYQTAGWRTYRVLAADERPARAEVICPASVEGGRSLVCMSCRLCDGASRLNGPNICERVHGSRATFFVRNRASHRVEASA